MGADIHAFIEFAHKDFETDKLPQSFSRDQLSLGRNYTLFGLLAGVRGDEGPVFPVRGVPAHLSSSTGWAYWYLVDDKAREKQDACGCEHNTHYCTKEQAETWVSQGLSQWGDDTHKRISDPDAHSASWLTLEELRKVADELRRNVGNNFILFDAVIAAMAAIEDGDRFKTRLVFWFDN